MPDPFGCTGGGGVGKGKKFVAAAAAMVFVLGLSVLLYPPVHGWIVDQKIQAQAVSFVEKLEVQRYPIKDQERFPQTDIEETQPRDHADLYEAMQQYNEQIYRECQAGLKDPWSYEQPSFTLENFGLTDEVFGVITIEKLDIEMPIYLGATYTHMADGAAHLSQTSIPIGGNNTNCVVAGHRGWGGAKYFRYITDLVAGDTVKITNLWETMTYTVCETQIIDPDDVEAIHIRPGRELLTLLTCHPYATGGRQRYLVICERNYDESDSRLPG